MKVSEVMTSDVQTVTPDQSAREAAQEALEGVSQPGGQHDQ
jgi:hypothetical protein